MSKKLYQTSDGTKFYQEQDAKNHALSLEDRKVIEVEREQLAVDSDKKPKENKKSAVELVAEIDHLETLEQLDDYEVYGQKTVKAAVEKRRAELTADIEVVSDEKTEEVTGEVFEDKGE